MLLGWAITSVSMCLLLAFSDLSAEAVVAMNGEGGGGGRREETVTGVAGGGAVGEPPSIPFLSFSLLMFGTGL